MGELSFAPYLDEASILQLLNVMGEGCRRDRQLGANVAAGKFSGFRDAGQELEAARIRQGLGNVLKLFLVHRGGVSACLYKWRRVQSVANCSPALFPANRVIYGGSMPNSGQTRGLIPQKSRFIEFKK